MNFTDDLAIAILAGGASTRMGRDKATLEVGGMPLLTRTALLALETGAPVCIVGREREESWPREMEVDFIPDEAPGSGPLGGLLAALRWSPRPRLLLLPCDLPLLQASALEWIATSSSTCSARDGLATTRGGELEPLFSVYSREAEERARKYLQGGRRSLRELIEGGDFDRAECPPEVAAQIVNCNTPEQWREATGATAVEDA